MSRQVLTDCCRWSRHEGFHFHLPRHFCARNFQRCFFVLFISDFCAARHLVSTNFTSTAECDVCIEWTHFRTFSSAYHRRSGSLAGKILGAKTVNHRTCVACGYAVTHNPNHVSHRLALSRVSAIVGTVVVFDNGHRITAIQPAAQIHFRTAVRTKGMILHL